MALHCSGKLVGRGVRLCFLQMPYCSENGEEARADLSDLLGYNGDFQQHVLQKIMAFTITMGHKAIELRIRLKGT